MSDVHQLHIRFYKRLKGWSIFLLLSLAFQFSIPAQSVSRISGIANDSIVKIMGISYDSSRSFLGISTDIRETNNTNWQNGDDWFDSRDSSYYGTAVIGNQTWMTDNLKYQGATSADFYDGDSATYAIHGRYYTASQLMNGDRTTLSSPSSVQGLCPVGWHLPSTAEFDSLFSTINASHTSGSSCSSCGGEIKDTGTTYWNSPNTGADNSTGLTVLGSGRHTGSAYSEIKSAAYLWSASYNPSSTTAQVYYILSSSNDQVIFTSTTSSSFRHSARCVKNTPNANAGKDQLITSDTTTTLAADSAIAPETAYWSIISGGGGVLSDSSLYNTTFSGRSDSSYQLVWTVIFAPDTSRDTVLIEFTPANQNWQPGNDWLDARDNETYGTVQIGNQTWMKENLRYKGSTSADFYDGDSATYAAFGRLYSRSEARNSERLTLSSPSDVQGACPTGWHLPSTAEFDSLITQINPSHSASSSCTSCGGELKESSTEFWSAPNTGADNSTGFTALGSGFYSGSAYSSIYTAARFWTASYNESTTTAQDYYTLSSSNDQLIYASTTSNSLLHSVRCVKNTPNAYAGEDQLLTSDTVATLAADSAVLPETAYWSIISGGGGTLTDSSLYNTTFTGRSDSSYQLVWTVIFAPDTSRDTVLIQFTPANQNWQAGDDWLDTRDNETYGTVQIGNQTWMKENLRYKGTTSADFYDGDSATYAAFGRLYSRSEARNSERLTLSSPSGVQGACPTGWHLPSTAEFDTLLTQIDATHSANSSCTTCGGELKESSTLYWAAPNTGADNSTGFTALGSGYYSGSAYSSIYTATRFWTASYNTSSTTAQVFYSLSSSNDQMILSSTTSSALLHSVRCVKNTPNAYAGEDQLLTSDTVATLAADSAVLPETAYWSIISGGGGSLSDSSLHNTTFTGRSDSSYQLVWTVIFAPDTSRDTVLIQFTPANQNWQPGNEWLDPRDNETYGTVQIGSQTWMKENLRYKGTTSADFYDGDSATYAAFGRLYTRTEARNSERLTLSSPSGVQGACPTGWHLPSTAEFDTLLTHINPSHTAGSSCNSCGGELKENTTLYWTAPNTSADNSTGFTALGSGYYTGSTYSSIYSLTRFWSTSYNESSTTSQVYYSLSSSNDQLTFNSTTSTSVAHSVRCIKDLPQANAGEDQLITTGTTASLAADSAILPETAYWSIAAGNGGVIADVNDPNSKFVGTQDSSYQLVWTVIFAPDTSRDTVNVEFTAANANWQAGKDWLDPRDNETYGTVQIGNQTWMSENLNYRSSSSAVYYDNDSSTYSNFGRLYLRSEARNSERLTLQSPSGIQGVCPSGWHLPSTAEYDSLFTTINAAHTSGSSCSTCGGELKESTTLYWSAPNTGADNSTGFTALGGGRYTGSTFSGAFSSAYFWSASYNTANTSAQVHYSLFSSNDQAIYSSTSGNSLLHSVRCVKDEVSAYAGRDILLPKANAATLTADPIDLPWEGKWTIISGSGGVINNADSSTTDFSGNSGDRYELEWAVTFDGVQARDTVIVDFDGTSNANWSVGEDWLDDRDGETYGTVQIGNQYWMTENIRYIPKTGTSYHFDDDSASYHATRGRLYNHSTALASETPKDSTPSGIQGVCPTDWHIPSIQEFDSLLMHINASHTAQSTCSTCGGELKQEYTAEWAAPNTSADNSTGFNAIGAGTRSTSSFANSYFYTYFWTSSYYPSTTNGAAYFLSYNNDQFIFSSQGRTNFLSVRCVKDSTK